MIRSGGEDSVTGPLKVSEPVVSAVSQRCVRMNDGAVAALTIIGKTTGHSPATRMGGSEGCPAGLADSRLVP